MPERAAPDRVPSWFDPSTGGSRWTDYALVAAASGVVLTVALRFGLARTGLVTDPDRVWIIAVWLVAIAASVGALLLNRRARVRGTVGLPIALAAAGGLLFAVFLSVVRNDWYADVWIGFTVDRIGLGALIALVVLLAAGRVGRLAGALTAVACVLTALLLVAYLFQTAGSFTGNYDNAFTLEDLLAPSAGRMPAFDYIAQYSMLLGYPLALAALVAPDAFAESPQSFAVGWVVLLQLVAFAVAIAAAIRVAARPVRWLMPLIIVPVAFLVGAAGLLYYADLPLRFLLPTLLLGLVVLLRVRRPAAGAPWWHAAVLGLLGGAAAFNNLDYGVPGLLAAGAVVVVAAPSWGRRFAAAGWYLAGVVAVPLLVVLAGAATGRALHPEYLLFFVRTFGLDGFFGELMQSFGLHASFVFLGLFGVVLGVLGARARSRRVGALYQAILFQSAWLLLSLVYFSGRSLTPTLVTGSCFLGGVLLALLAAAGYDRLTVIRRRPRADWRRPDWSVAMLTVLALAVPIAAWTYLPSPAAVVEKFARAAQPAPDAFSYLGPSPAPALELVPDGEELIGVLTISGSTWQGRLDVPNAGLFVHPNYLELGNGAVLQCEHLEGLPGALLLTTAAIAEVLEAADGCDAQLAFDQAIPLGPASGADWVLLPRP